MTFRFPCYLLPPTSRTLRWAKLEAVPVDRAMTGPATTELTKHSVLRKKNPESGEESAGRAFQELHTEKIKAAMGLQACHSDNPGRRVLDVPAAVNSTDNDNAATVPSTQGTVATALATTQPLLELGLRINCRGGRPRC